MSLGKIFKNWRVLILLVFLVLAVLAINPNPWQEGAAIRSVVKNSSASNAGIVSPSPTATPRSREVILTINNIPIKDSEGYFKIISAIDSNRTIQLRTNKKTYRLTTGTDFNVTRDLGLRVYDAPKNNIRKGLDLQGGTRVLLKPETKMSDDDMGMLIENMKERLNVYGLTDLIVRETSDLSGNQYVMVEIAGANEEEVRELLEGQGKFEAKIGNKTVFKGGGDITYVCRTAECSGIDPQNGCGQTAQSQWVCRFLFSIAMNADAAKRQADLTKNLSIVTENQEQYLSEKLYLFLDDVLVDELNIGADLKGRPTTDIAISGSGAGVTEQEAMFDALKNMKRLQTILITGSLPVKLEIVQTNNLSPILGEQFLNNIMVVAILAILAVAAVIFIRYRRLEISVPVIFTIFFEILLVLGLAAIIGWNLDLAAIAGIVISAGTGVNDQIVITDEVMKGEKSSGTGRSFKDKIKGAFFIIFAAYSTVVVAMVPLLFAGGGLLKGFAITTIAGITMGVLLTRPAFAYTIEVLISK